MSSDKQLLGHVSDETAFVVEDYPYGYTMRTKIRYWIERSKNGERFVSQTLNPKTQQWNAPKRSTYDLICLLLQGENGHVRSLGVSKFIASDTQWIDELMATYKLDSWQLDQCKQQKALILAMKEVTWTVKASSYGSVSLMSQAPEDVEKRRLIAEEQEQHKREQQKALSAIQSHAAAIYKRL